MPSRDTIGLVPAQGEPRDPTLAEIRDEFPAWRVWKGVNEMLYAQQGSPPITFREENGTELRARLASWYRTHPRQERILGTWPDPPWKA